MSSFLIKIRMIKKYKVVIELREDGWLVVLFQLCYHAWESLEKALGNAEGAIEAYLESLEKNICLF
jgi:predicted RNase H-like HicB family nuclease